MSDYIGGKSVIVTGAGGGFGALVSKALAERGAKLTCADINPDTLRETVAAIEAGGGTAQGLVTDVTDFAAMSTLAQAAVSAYGRVDVMVNNAGIMPLAFHADHALAREKWSACIDINIKGVLNGIMAVHDQMIAQGEGQVINVSSIYGNFPVAGAGVYGATKSAVNFLSESLRLESRGKIKVTTVKPTGVPATGLGAGVVNPEATAGIVGLNAAEFFDTAERFREGELDPALLDEDSMANVFLDPANIAKAILHAIDQPRGVSIGEITVRASGDHFIL